MVMMPLYMDSANGQMPEGWQALQLGDLLAFQNGMNADKSAYGHGLPFINVLEVISRAHVRVEDIPGRVSVPADLVETYKVRNGDVLFNRTSETQEEVGLAATFLGHGEVVFGGFVIRGRPRGKRLDPIFSSYALRSSPVRTQIVSRGQGGIRANIGQSDLAQVSMLLPPLPEQEAIAEALSNADAYVESLEQLIAKKRLVKQGAMQELLTGKRRLPGFGSNWIDAGLDLAGHCYRGVSYDPDLDLFSGDTASSVRLLRSNNVQASRIAFDDVQYVDQRRVSRDQLLREGDILICMANGSRDLVGKAGRFADDDGLRYTFGAFMGCFRPDGKNVDPDFAFYQFQTESYRRHIAVLLAGSSINNLTPRNVELLAIRIPSDQQEQTAIASVLSDMDDEIAELESNLTKARNVKHGMMQNLLTGKVRLV